VYIGGGGGDSDLGTRTRELLRSSCVSGAPGLKGGVTGDTGDHRVSVSVVMAINDCPCVCAPGETGAGLYIVVTACGSDGVVRPKSKPPLSIRGDGVVAGVHFWPFSASPDESNELLGDCEPGDGPKDRRPRSDFEDDCEDWWRRRRNNTAATTASRSPQTIPITIPAIAPGDSPCFLSVQISESCDRNSRDMLVSSSHSHTHAAICWRTFSADVVPFSAGLAEGNIRHVSSKSERRVGMNSFTHSLAQAGTKYRDGGKVGTAEFTLADVVRVAFCCAAAVAARRKTKR
jgi:hypothetical protein